MKVLIIRSARKAHELKNLLVDHDFEVVAIPLLEIGAVDAKIWQTQLQTYLQQSISGLIFVSLNAIDYFMRGCDDFETLQNTPCFAVGSSTADELRLFGFKNVYCPNHELGSEALLKLPEMLNVAGKNFVIVRGTNGREFIGETLQERGAHVHALTVYTNNRQILTEDEIDLLRQNYDAIVVSSTEALRYLIDLKSRYHLNQLTKAALLVMSERQEQLAGLEDFKNFVKVPSVNNDEILTSLSNYRKLKLSH